MPKHIKNNYKHLHFIKIKHYKLEILTIVLLYFYFVTYDFTYKIKKFIRGYIIMHARARARVCIIIRFFMSKEIYFEVFYINIFKKKLL